MAGILACVPIALSAAQPGLPAAVDLAQDAEAMRAARMPMVVLYSQASCSYCDEARTYLVPMARVPANAQRVLFRQIDIDSDAPLTDFAGQPSTHRRLAQTLGAKFTPTVAVLDAEGKALGEPILGMRLADFYGQYVENAIDEARTALAARP
ncbi:MAG: thioredoxin fold domain-containing protein [Thauera sp.]